MMISIYGLGYVGCVGVGCLSELGHHVIGVDVDPSKVALIRSGKGTIIEKGIDELIAGNLEKGLIQATTNSRDAVQGSEVAILCVGTPNDPNGHLDMSQIDSVAKEIGRGLKIKEGFYTVAIRSTVLPGTNKRLEEIIAAESGKLPQTDFAVVNNPEFLREGSAVADFFHPPYTVLASRSARGIDVMKDVYAKIGAETIETDIGSAELIKFVNNSFHALKVVFANEVGRICKVLGADGRVLMDLFSKDRVLNISPYYFRPGFAYGGSCLPKDLKALNTIGHDRYLKLPILSSIESSNQCHIDHALNLILRKRNKTVGFYGISFKAGTDDLRFSPALELAERLVGKGYAVRIYDKNVNISRLMGKNRDFLFQKLPHINDLLFESLDRYFEGLGVLVIVNRDEQCEQAIRSSPPSLEILDFAGLPMDHAQRGRYEGICW